MQRRIELDGELFKTDVPPRQAWGFSPQEVTVYNIINDADHPVIVVPSVDQLRTLVTRAAPFLESYLTELGQLPSPVASDQVIAALANRSEANRGGHSLDRHGPQMGMPQLQDRLTTGFVGGVFAPAGALGFATGFTSHEAFLISQQAALVHIQAAYTATANGLHPLVGTLKVRIRGLHGLTGANIGKQKQLILQARKAIGDFITTNGLNSPATAPLNMLPVRTSAVTFNNIQRLAYNEDDQVDALLEFFDRYRIVLANAAPVGRGLRVPDTEINRPIGHVRNPAFPLAGVPEPIFDAHQLQSMAEIQNTATTVNPPRATFGFGLNVATWAVPQHFPDNGAPGWRG